MVLVDSALVWMDAGGQWWANHRLAQWNEAKKTRQNSQILGNFARNLLDLSEGNCQPNFYKRNAEVPFEFVAHISDILLYYNRRRTEQSRYDNTLSDVFCAAVHRSQLIALIPFYFLNIP